MNFALEDELAVLAKENVGDLLFLPFSASILALNQSGGSPKGPETKKKHILMWPITKINAMFVRKIGINWVLFGDFRAFFLVNISTIFNIVSIMKKSKIKMVV